MPLTDELVARLAPDGVTVGGDGQKEEPWLEVAPERLLAVCQTLRDDPKLAFDYLNCVTGVDYFEPDPAKRAKSSIEPRIELVYHLTSLTRRTSLTLKVRLPRWKDDTPGQLPEAPSVSPVWQAANWHERETFDLVGVRFLGHPDLTRILCPDDWVGHPLRKDYEQPLEYHGIRGR